MRVRVPGCIRPPHPQNSMKQLRKQADEFVFMTTTIGPRGDIGISCHCGRAVTDVYSR